MVPGESCHPAAIPGVYGSRFTAKNASPLQAHYPDIAAKQYDFSYQNFMRAYKRFMHDTAEPLSQEKAARCQLYATAYAYPNIAAYPVARIGVRSIVLRDLCIADAFTRHWKAGNSIFSWYGATHVLAIQTYLENLGEPVDALATGVICIINT